jgi:YVTN family beta-propeller protein
VPNSRSDTASVIDGATNTVTATVPVGSVPVGVGVDPSTDMIYLANSSSDSVSVIDGATNTVTGQPRHDRPVGHQPRHGHLHH